MGESAHTYLQYLVQQALGERALSSALTFDLSGHWQQLSALGSALHACTATH